MCPNVIILKTKIKKILAFIPWQHKKATEGAYQFQLIENPTCAVPSLDSGWTGLAWRDTGVQSQWKSAFVCRNISRENIMCGFWGHRRGCHIFHAQVGQRGLYLKWKHSGNSEQVMSAFFFSTHPAMVVGAQTFASKEGGLLFKSCESSHQTKGCETAIWFAFLSIIIAIFFHRMAIIIVTFTGWI